MQISKSINPFVFLFKVSFFIMLVTFSLPLFAEYYLVKEVKSTNHVYCHIHHQHHYRSTLTHTFLQQQHKKHSKKIKYRYTHIYLPFNDSNDNLDMITGDDDPYVYPGMNIDR